MINLDNEFIELHEDLQLNQTQQNRIESAVSAISSHIKGYYEIDEQDVFLQGSVATQTIIKPQDSSVEYDVDIVAVLGDIDSDPDILLLSLEDCFKANEIYSKKLDDNKDRPCIRLQYAEENAAKFHVDIVPTRLGTHSPLEMPTRKGGWKETAPREFAQWSLDHSDDYRKVVMILKRWRDNQDVEIPSVTLQVLVADAVEGKTYNSFTEMIVDCISAIYQRFEDASSRPSILNPTLLTEDFANKWDDEDFERFKTKLSDAYQSVNAAYLESDKEAAIALWQKVLGSSFTTTTESTSAVVLNPQQLALTLGDTSHAQIAPWRQLEKLYSANISATATWSIEKKVFKRYNYWQTIKMSAKIRVNLGQHLNKGLLLDYYLNTDAPKPYTVHWQVVNTGEEARDDLRGDIKERTGHHIQEHTKYTGTHWVEAYVVKDNICIARTNKFYINIG